jgi:predicted CXXCH cytochrome family protein
MESREGGAIRSNAGRHDARPYSQTVSALRKEVRTVRRLALLIAVGTLWLFLAALPALADGGPHVAADNSGVSTLTADGCAGCHRAHTAQAPLLLTNEEPDLCFTCHGETSLGATTDVMTGVQYAVGTQNPRGDAILGALRGGGFVEARLDAGSMERLSYLRTATAISTRVKIGVGDAEPVTSSHMALTQNGLVLGGKVWGNGAAGTDAGPAAEVSCTNCHNPHGNGQYRILRPLQTSTSPFDDGWVVNIGTSVAASDLVGTQTSHALLAGDQITIAGHTGSTPDINGTWYVLAATAFGNTFTISASPGGQVVDITVGGSGGTVTRLSGVPVTDATLPGDGDTRNYTIMEVRGDGTNEATYLLYASNVLDARAAGSFGTVTDGDFGPTGGDYFHRAVPWNPSVDQGCDPATNNGAQGAACTTANMAPNGRPSTFNAQMTAWCSTCHTRYFANNVPTTPGATGTAASWAQPRPDESIFKFQHRTVAGRDCLTCHVSHGSNAEMSGEYSGNFPYPDDTLSGSSRLLKVDNRGTCQACHDPTETVEAGTFLYYLNGAVTAEEWDARTYDPSVP